MLAGVFRIERRGRYSVLVGAVTILLLTLSILFIAALPASACNVPVFRYALERWPSDPYEVVVFHNGPLSGDDQGLIDKLKGSSSANITFRAVDLSQQPGETEKPPELPWLVLRYPAATRIRERVWAGRLREDVVQTLLDSPARQEIGKRILRGDSAVWLLLESGKKEADEAAATLLQTRLKAMQETLKLPERTNAPADRVANEEELPVRLAFSLLRLRRDNPAERFLVRMLLGTEPDLAGYAEPMVFPVFGRARVLHALVGAGITADNLEESSRYVIGACSCEVKRQNPGVDLLTSTDWDAALQGKGATEPELPPLVGLSNFLPESADAATPAANEAKTATEPDAILFGTPAVVSVAGFAFVAGLAFWLIGGKRARAGKR